MTYKREPELDNQLTISSERQWDSIFIQNAENKKLSQERTSRKNFKRMQKKNVPREAKLRKFNTSRHAERFCSRLKANDTRKDIKCTRRRTVAAVKVQLQLLTDSKASRITQCGCICSIVESTGNTCRCVVCLTVTAQRRWVD